MRVPLWLRRAAPVVYAAFIFWLSSQARPVFFGTLSLNDKVKHMALYGVFAGLVYQALATFLQARPALFWLTVGIVSLYGATDEYHQWFVPGRSSDVMDWVADTAAAMIVGAALAAWSRRRAPA